jgi:hypothetical protein
MAKEPRLSSNEKWKNVLGSEVKDTVTGLKGIGTGRIEWLNGCRRVSIQAKAVAGVIPDAQWVDLEQVELVRPKKVKSEDRGGPMPTPKYHEGPKRR